MPKYTVVTDEIYLVGKGWYNDTIAYDLRLTSHDLQNIIDDAQYQGTPINRDVVQRYIDKHSGDFSSITDWSADFGHLDLCFDWETDEGEYDYNDCMYPPEEVENYT